tara:strand:+ start:675 stop:1775 length:1101 start_codon:yes stop_codon:yes gene_type:complete
MAYGNLKADNLIFADSTNNNVDTVVPLAHVAGKASLASPAFTGTPTAPTAGTSVNTTQLATTEYVTTAVAAVDLSAKADLVGANFTGDVDIAQGDKLTLGGNYEIYEVSGSSELRIESLAGHMRHKVPASQSVLIEGPTGSIAQFTEGGACELYHDDIKRLSTTNVAVDVTGILTVSGSAHFGAASNTSITSSSDGSGGYHTMLENGSTGDLYLRGTEFYLQDNGTGNANQSWIHCLPSAGVEISHDGSKKLETTTAGVTVTGELTSTTTFQPFIDGTQLATAAANTKYTTDTSSAAFTIQLPVSPTVGQYVTVTDIKGTWATNNLTVAQNGNNIQGAAADLVCNVNHAYVTLIYTADATTGWVVT